MTIREWVTVVVVGWLVVCFGGVAAWVVAVEVSRALARRRRRHLIDLTGVKPIPFDRPRLGA
jgi:type IV secretory pathway TrbD component